MAHSPECGHDHCELSNKCSCSHCMHRPGVPHPQPLLPGYLSWSVLMHAECSVKTPCMDINSSSPFKYLLHMRHYRVPKKGFILSLSFPFSLWFFFFLPLPLPCLILFALRQDLNTWSSSLCFPLQTCSLTLLSSTFIFKTLLVLPWEIARTDIIP